MIKRQDLTRIGRIHKPHGHAGELSASVSPDIDLKRLRFVVMNIDGIFVPFMVTGARTRGTEAQLLTLDGIDSDRRAADFTGMELFAPTDRLKLAVETDDENVAEDDGSIGVDSLIGFHILSDGKDIGEITDIDDSTPNTLFVVENHAGNTFFIPVADDFITEIDIESTRIIMDLPDGLVSL